MKKKARYLQKGRAGWLEYKNLAFKPQTDFVALRAELMYRLMEHGPLTSEQLAKAVKGVPGCSNTMRAIRYMAEDKTIWREDNRHPWKVGRGPA